MQFITQTKPMVLSKCMANVQQVLVLHLILLATAIKHQLIKQRSQLSAICASGRMIYRQYWLQENLYETEPILLQS
jgi:hypothetical protein